MTRRSKTADADLGTGKPGSIRSDGLTYDRDAAIAHLRDADPMLAALIDAAPPFDVRPDQDIDPFAYLLRSIVFQQLNGTAAGTIHGRVLDLFAGCVPAPDELLATDESTLRGAGLSANKLASIRDLATHARDGTLPSHDELPRMTDLEIVDRLTAVRGIGPWTVHMLLLFRLGRPDVLATGDFGVREGLRLLRGDDAQLTPSALRDLARPWRPYRSVASWYLWRCVDLHRAGTPIVLP